MSLVIALSSSVAWVTCVAPDPPAQLFPRAKHSEATMSVAAAIVKIVTRVTIFFSITFN